MKEKIEATKGNGTISAIFNKLGVAIIRNPLPEHQLGKLIRIWNDFYNSADISSREICKFNPVNFKHEFPEEIEEIYKSEHILDIIEEIVGKNIGIYGRKALYKDAASDGAIFLHQDGAYQHGFPHKVTTFFAVTKATPLNGAIEFYLGTHKWGYLGDAGAINADLLLPDRKVIQPALEPGDFVLMNPYLWHSSTACLNHEPRMLYTTTYQPAEDPSTIEIVRGNGTSDYNFMNKFDRADYFTRSRSSRLIELEAETNKLKERLNKSMSIQDA